MSAFLIRRILQCIPLLIGITVLVFLLINAVPGSPVGDLALNPGTRPEDVARIKHQLGLDQPLYKRYFVWISNESLQTFYVCSIWDSESGKQETAMQVFDVLVVFKLQSSFQFGCVDPVKQDAH